MAELLIQVRPKIHDDPYKDVACLKRGDVIVAKPDGWNWGGDERTSHALMIVKLPHVSIDEAESLCASERDTNVSMPSRMLQSRLFHLDLDHPSWPDEARAACVPDETRAVESLTVPSLDIAAVRRMKAPVRDPAHLTSEPTVL